MIYSVDILRTKASQIALWDCFEELREETGHIGLQKKNPPGSQNIK